MSNIQRTRMFAPSSTPTKRIPRNPHYQDEEDAEILPPSKWEEKRIASDSDDDEKSLMCCIS